MSDAPTPYDPTEPIDSDVACAGCGYNLRGLTLGMQCPECAMAVARSVRGPYLQYADPTWIGRIARGTSLYRWSIVFHMLLALVGGVGGGVIAARGGMPGASLMLIASFAGFVGQFLGLWATFLITAQEPRIALQEDPLTLRNVVRVTAVAHLLGQVFSSTANLPLLTGVASGLADVTAAVGAILSFAGLITFFGLFVYFRRFALRIPDLRLAQNTRTVMWGFIFSYGVLLVGGVVALLIVGSPGRVGVPGASVGLIGGGLVACVAIVAVIVFVCWSYRLLMQYNRAFKQAAAEARSYETRPAIPQ